ncbi:MAG: NAD-dependent epimerase/dehydratase family protein [Nitrospirota bacterium]
MAKKNFEEEAEMRVGIIGSGQIAKIHASLIMKEPGVKLVGIVDKNLIRAKALATEEIKNSVYQDAGVMIDELKPDVVHVLTPPQFHAPLSIMAMNKGCHVLVEKPMALTVEECEEMTKVAKERKVKLCVDHNMIYDEVIQEAMKLASGGLIGDLISVEVRQVYNARRSPAIIEEGAQFCHWTYQLNGGVLQDLMPHPASLIVEYLTEIKELQCIGHNRGLLPGGWQDEVRVLVKSNDVIGYISISLSEKPDMMTLTLGGTKGIIHANCFNNILVYQKKLDLPRAIARGLSGFSLASQYFRGSLKNIYKIATGRIDKSGGIGLVISRFYESIRKGQDAPISLEKSRHVVDLINRVWPVPAINSSETSSFAYITRKNLISPAVLVTGASGFIGIHLIKKLLSEKIGVRALVRPGSIHAGRLRNLDVDIVEGDLSDADILYEATKGIDTIYHAGATSSNDWEEHYQINIKGTEDIINAALAHSVKRFVYLSTIVAYDLLGLKSNAIISENSDYQKKPALMGPYAYSKIEAEKLVLKAYREKGLGATVVRLGIVIGPLGRIFFPYLGYHYQDKLFILTGNGDKILPLTYVENTVNGIYIASVRDKAIGQVYNLIDDGEITRREYLEKFINVTGIKARIISLPYIIPYLATAAYETAAFCGLVRKGVTSRAQLKWKQVKVQFDNTKAKEELGWQQSVPLEEGLQRTFKWYAEKNKS